MKSKIPLIQFACLIALMLFISPVVAQHQDSAHQHPPGVNIRMGGTLVDPVCYFVNAAGAKNCAQMMQEHHYSPVLVGNDGVLYLLHPAQPKAKQQLLEYRGKTIYVVGIVYPAANGYLIIVEDVEPKPNHPVTER